MSATADTIAALATPSGESAIALLRASGPAVRIIAAEILGRPPRPRVATHSRFCDESGAAIDDVLITFFEGPASYTGEDVIEISGHGNPILAARMLEILFKRGCRPAEPGEFTRRAFLNGRMDLTQAEAVMDLIRARSDRAIAAANWQLHGALGRKIGSISETLLGVTARCEAYIDFPEEDLPPEDRDRLRVGIESVLEPLSTLLATGRYGELLRSGVRAVIAGETNAGKSSLLNGLLGWDRALVSSDPGTTRDYIEEQKIVGGHCIRFIDTAGVNPAPGAIEDMGISRAMELAARADLVLLVLDSTLPFPDFPPVLLASLCSGNTILVWNKRDLSIPGCAPAKLKSFRSVSVCATTGTGLDELEQAITDLVEAQNLMPGPEVVSINARHEHDLKECRDCLERALAKISLGEPDELLALELRCALDSLGRIGGKIDNERMLDMLFREFCIGK